MGVFSTLQIEPPLYCPYCGEQHKDCQTYSVGYCEYYKVGDQTPRKEIGALILKDQFICFGKDHDKLRSKALNLNGYTFVQYCFNCFNNGVYVGTVLNRDDALLLLDFPDNLTEETVY